MGYSEAAMQGVKANGRTWKATIRGVPAIIERLRVAYDAKDASGIDQALRDIAAKFRPHMPDDKLSFGQMEDIEWFEEESCAYEMQEGLMHEWSEEFDYRLSSLYDFADYHRIWVSPDLPPPPLDTKPDNVGHGGADRPRRHHNAGRVTG